MPYGPKPESFESKYARLTARIPFCGCHIWLGELDRHGYGKTRSGGKRTLVHRESYRHFVGEIKSENVVMHSCDTPSCVNPNHLSQGTVMDNAKDKVSKGRQACGVLCNVSTIDDSIALDIFNAKGRQLDIAKKFGVSQSTVSMIKRKLYWKHIHKGMI